MPSKRGLDKMQRLETPRDRCPDCGSTVLINKPDTGEVICSECGLVVSEQSFDRGPEWRAFTVEEKAERSRTGGPVTLLQADKGLPTVITATGKDAFGRKVSAQTRFQMMRLRRWQARTQYQSPTERNLLQALSELDRVVDKLHIQEDLQQQAARIYRDVLEKGLVRGRSIAAVVAASLYAACRRSGRPRSLKEIASVSRVTLKDIARCYRLLIQETDMKMPVPDPTAYVSKIASRCNISERIRKRAVEILREGEKMGILTGKDPMGIAAAALYIGCLQAGQKKTQKEIAEAAGVTEVTVRNRYKGLKNALKIEVAEPE